MVNVLDEIKSKTICKLYIDRDKKMSLFDHQNNIDFIK